MMKFLRLRALAMRVNTGNTLVPNTFYRLPISIMLGLALLSWPQIVHAVLIDNGNTTVDTDTGLTWLDLTETQQTNGLEITKPAVKALLGPGELLDHYRIATPEEVHAFMTNAGVQNSTTGGPTSFTAADVAAGAAWSALVDETLQVYYGLNFFGSRGYVEIPPSIDPPDYDRLIGYYVEGPQASSPFWRQWTNDYCTWVGGCLRSPPGDDSTQPLGGAGWWLVLKAIDIEPSKDQNKINLCSKKTVPVAILSTAALDAPTEINPARVTLAGAGVKTVGKDNEPKTQTSDVNGDGLSDLIVFAVTEDLDLGSGDTEAELIAFTFSGTEIREKDWVQITRYMCSRTLEE